MLYLWQFAHALSAPALERVLRCRHVTFFSNATTLAIAAAVALKHSTPVGRRRSRSPVQKQVATKLMTVSSNMLPC